MAKYGWFELDDVWFASESDYGCVIQQRRSLYFYRVYIIKDDTALHCRHFHYTNQDRDLKLEEAKNFGMTQLLLFSKSPKIGIGIAPMIPRDFPASSTDPKYHTMTFGFLESCLKDLVSPDLAEALLREIRIKAENNKA